MKVENEQFSFSFFEPRNPSIIFNFLQDDLETLPEGTVSQNALNIFLCYVQFFQIICSTIL